MKNPVRFSSPKQVYDDHAAHSNLESAKAYIMSEIEATPVVGSEGHAVVVRPEDVLPAFEGAMTSVIAALGLPVDEVFVDNVQRVRVLTNLDAAIEQLSPDCRLRAAYLSKLVTAVGAGLFDAALNYLWDETVSELRRRIAAYDLDYFFDTAVKDPDRRKMLNDAEDLARVADSELIDAAREMELISEIGFRELDLIRYMRNWASAAHPNQTELTALQLLQWLEACIRQVIALPETNVVAEKKRLLSNVRSQRMTEQQLKDAAEFFAGLDERQSDSLAAGFFGIFCRHETSEEVRDNIRILFPRIWDGVGEDQRSEFGTKFGRYTANGDVQQAAHARELLDIVDATAYLPEAVRAAEIAAASDSLRLAHNGWDNFYNEPPQARLLRSLVGGQAVPAQVRHTYVKTLVEVFLTNGNGVARNAEPIYKELIGGFDQEEANAALMAIRDSTISSRLRHSLPREKFAELIKIIEPKLDNRHKQILQVLRDSNLTVDKAIKETRFKRLVDNLNP